MGSSMAPLDVSMPGSMPLLPMIIFTDVMVAATRI
jgi:hypothetical protein